LDDDFARFQIIAKVPYPSLASQKNKLRQKMNPDWYNYRTISEICQMTGRIIRSNSDWGDTIIIDGGFGDVIKHSSQFLPDWIQDAVKRINVKIEA
jgi:Rad3-related DNA helicase